MADQMAEEDVVLAGILAWKPDKARQNSRHLDHGEAAAHLPALLDLQLDHHVQRFVEQLGKRMRRIDAERRQDGPDLGPVIIFDPGEVRFAELGDGRKPDTVPGQGGHQILAPAAVLLIDHAPDALGDAAQVFRGGQAVHAALDHAAFHLLLQSGHTHFEEFVQVGAGDAEEFDPLQERG